MPEGDQSKLNRVEELKNKLFSRNYEMRIEHRDNFTHPTKKEVPDSWAKKTNIYPATEKFFMKTSVFKKFFIFSVVFFMLAVAYAAYTFFAGGNTVSNDNIEISVTGNTFTAGGEELPLTIGVINKNNSPIELADLVVEYPKSSSGDSSEDLERLRQSLGTIPGGGVRNENVNVILYGEQGSVRPIKISLEYRVEGSNAIFVKEKGYEVSINSTPIDILLEAPTALSPNQDMALKIKATLNSTRAASGIAIKVDYPVGFEFTSSEPKPSVGNNVWNLGDLAPGAERNILIQGKMVDVSDGEEKTFRVTSGLPSETDKSIIGVIFNSLSHTVAISRPFIEAKLSINGVYQKDYTIDSKNKFTGEINWTNNLDTQINDMEIHAKITGNALNKKTINAERGFYNSLEDEIVWDKNSQSKFKEINPGESGVVVFTASPLALFSAADGLLSEPSINIDVSIEGLQELSGFSTKDLQNSESKKIRVISDVGLVAKILHFSGAFADGGPVPPKVAKETTYTVVWDLSNTSNNISKAQVRSTLPTWIKFVGPVSPTTEDLSYNTSTREVTWNIGQIPKGTGITAANKQVSFQIAFTPSLSQVGTVPFLINEAVLTGHDDFANVDVRLSKGALTTNLTGDPAFPSSGQTVVE